MPIEPPTTPWNVHAPVGTEDDLVAVGADLAAGTVLAAYRNGVFPMHLDGELAWWSPVERGVLRLASLKVSRSLRQSARHFEIRVNTAFAAVIEGCADPGRDGGWINDEIRDSFCELHRLGWAHSIEAWRDGKLAGGLYGVALGGLFAGESMFSRQRDASKVALVGLVDLLRDEYADQRLIDTQWRTAHLTSLGVTDMPRAEYLAGLEALLQVPLPAALDHG